MATPRAGLLAEYDAACVQRDRAQVEALMIRRRARLAGHAPDRAALADVARRIAEGNRRVARAEAALKAAHVTVYRTQANGEWLARNRVEAQRWVGEWASGEAA
jgi:hypothetical protein